MDTVILIVIITQAVFLFVLEFLHARERNKLTNKVMCGSFAEYSKGIARINQSENGPEEPFTSV